VTGEYQLQYQDGVLTKKPVIGGTTFLITEVTVFTDYENIQLVFSCVKEVGVSGLFGGYTIQVRNRKFNDLNLLEKVWEKVNKLPVPNAYTSVYQGVLCKN
jgi:hypothetical protein